MTTVNLDDKITAIARNIVLTLSVAVVFQLQRSATMVLLWVVDRCSAFSTAIDNYCQFG